MLGTEGEEEERARERERSEQYCGSKVESEDSARVQCLYRNSGFASEIKSLPETDLTNFQLVCCLSIDVFTLEEMSSTLVRR